MVLLVLFRSLLWSVRCRGFEQFIRFQANFMVRVTVEEGDLPRAVGQRHTWCQKKVVGLACGDRFRPCRVVRHRGKLQSGNDAEETEYEKSHDDYLESTVI
ncbi:MAG TPA: hypothetical protein DCR55_03960 [Lentisphaeria bacterium]|nr:hypothetical protein [Lentisphaeria bacterium]